jgi:hypothetical protein
VLLGRELLRDPFWVLHAAKELKHDIHWPVQYVQPLPLRLIKSLVSHQWLSLSLSPGTSGPSTDPALVSPTFPSLVGLTTRHKPRAINVQ